MTLINALRSYTQADEHGVMCVVSRQACDEAADEIERLRAALRPFSAAVFNDNGDVTISTGHITRGHYMAAYRALKK